MLTALNGDQRVEADIADRGLPYHCPGCGSEVVLKRGRFVIPHFAHKPPVSCGWAKGETLEHMRAKIAFRNALAKSYPDVQVEKLISSLPNDRRADIYFSGRSGERAVIELQHTSISLNEIEKRSSTYAREGIAQLWIALLSSKSLGAGEPTKGGIYIEKYPARPFERWIHGLHYGGILYFNSAKEELWAGRLRKHILSVEGSSWYNEYGEEETSDGYEKPSRRWKELTLKGPIKITQLSFTLKTRQPKSLGKYSWPGAKLLHLKTQ
jgi:competence protein CoiA